jgi:hypothetical protein
MNYRCRSLGQGIQRRIAAWKHLEPAPGMVQTFLDSCFEAVRSEISLGGCQFQSRAQRGPAPQLFRKRFDGSKSRSADVVFHPFYITIDDLLVKAEESQEVREEFVPLRNLARKGFAGCG